VPPWTTWRSMKSGRAPIWTKTGAACATACAPAAGRALRDRLDPGDIRAIDQLAVASAYAHWHRLLCTRFLAENHLLHTGAEHGSVASRWTSATSWPRSWAPATASTWPAVSPPRPCRASSGWTIPLCKLFHSRPFVWHLREGRKDGFHALVNYHRLDRAILEKLTYSYLGEIGDLIAAANAAYAKAAEAFRHLADTRLKSDALPSEHPAALFPHSPAQERNRTTPPKWIAVKHLFETRPDLQLPGVKGTFRAAYNAVTAFEDYRKARDDTPAKRLDRVWFGSGADLKVKALHQAMNLAA
jgi:hypothetical protein